MKRKLIYLYTFIGITVLISSANFLKKDRTIKDSCACAKTNKNKRSSEKSSAELFLPLHFIAIIK